MDVERTFRLSRPVDEVFAYLSDFENTAHWDPGTLETRRLSGDGGMGTVYANRSRFMGRTVSLTYETVGYDPPTFFACKGVNGRTTATDVMSFTPVDEAEGGGTQVQYRAQFDFPFPLHQLAPLLLRRPLDRIADETVEQITRVLG
jgi:carbon monoxide dehydrogenase subunit G